MPPVWTSALLRLLGVLIAGALIGAVYGQALAGMLVVALAALAWHLVNLYRLDNWLRTGETDIIPDGIGLWPPVFAKIEYIREKARRRRRRWRQLVRE